MLGSRRYFHANPYQNSPQFSHHPCRYGDCKKIPISCRPGRSHAPDRSHSSRLDTLGEQRQSRYYASLRDRSTLGDCTQHTFLFRGALVLQKTTTPPSRPLLKFWSLARCSICPSLGFQMNPAGETYTFRSTALPTLWGLSLHYLRNTL